MCVCLWPAYVCRVPFIVCVCVICALVSFIVRGHTMVSLLPFTHPLYSRIPSSSFPVHVIPSLYKMVKAGDLHLGKGKRTNPQKASMSILLQVRVRGEHRTLTPH